MKKNRIISILLSAVLLLSVFSLMTGCKEEKNESGPFSVKPIQGLTLETLCAKLSLAAILAEKNSFLVTNNYGTGAVDACAFAKIDGKTVGADLRSSSNLRIFNGESIYYLQNSAIFYTLLNYGRSYTEVIEEAFLICVLLPRLLEEKDITLETNLLDDGTGEAVCYFSPDSTWLSYFSSAPEKPSAGDTVKVYVELDKDMNVSSITYSVVTNSGGLIKILSQEIKYNIDFSYPETKLDWQNTEKHTVTVTNLDDAESTPETFLVPTGSRICCDPYDETKAETMLFKSRINIISYYWKTTTDLVKEDINIYISNTIK